MKRSFQNGQSRISSRCKQRVRVVGAVLFGACVLVAAHKFLPNSSSGDLPDNPCHPILSSKVGARSSQASNTNGADPVRPPDEASALRSEPAESPPHEDGTTANGRSTEDARADRPAALGQFGNGGRDRGQSGVSGGGSGNPFGGGSQFGGGNQFGGGSQFGGGQMGQGGQGGVCIAAKIQLEASSSDSLSQRKAQAMQSRPSRGSFHSE